MFDQIVEMSEEEWSELKETPERTMEDGQMSPITNHIDVTDPMDSYGFEDIEMEAVDEEGSPVEPEDYYNPQR